MKDFMVNKRPNALIYIHGHHKWPSRTFYFVEYIFDNSEVTVGKQRYDMILDDIKPFMKEGYSLYLTGHRYVSLWMLKITHSALISILPL